MEQPSVFCHHVYTHCVQFLYVLLHVELVILILLENKMICRIFFSQTEQFYSLLFISPVSYNFGKEVIHSEEYLNSKNLNVFLWMLYTRANEPKVCLNLLIPIQKLLTEVRSYPRQIKQNQFLFPRCTFVENKKEMKHKNNVINSLKLFSKFGVSITEGYLYIKQVLQFTHCHQLQNQLAY